MDIISNGGFVGNAKETLVEVVLRDLVDKGNKESKGVKARSSKRAPRATPRHKSSIATIITNIILNSLKENTDDVEKQSDDTLEQTTEESENEKENAVHGGYGTIKPYVGMSPYVKYVDYRKIWSHLGTFRTYRMFEHLDDVSNTALANGESSRGMISERTMDMGARTFKYFVKTNINNITQDFMTVTSLVPPLGANVDSKEWEKYTLMMKMSIYQPLIKLRFKFA